MLFTLEEKSEADFSQRRKASQRFRKEDFVGLGSNGKSSFVSEIWLSKVSVPDSQVETLEEGTPKDSPVFSLVDLRNLRSRRSIGVW